MVRSDNIESDRRGVRGIDCFVGTGDNQIAGSRRTCRPAADEPSVTPLETSGAPVPSGPGSPLMPGEFGNQGA